MSFKRKIQRNKMKLSKNDKDFIDNLDPNLSFEEAFKEIAKSSGFNAEFHDTMPEEWKNIEGEWMTNMDEDELNEFKKNIGL